MMNVRLGILKFIDETELALEECAELYTVFLEELHSECDALENTLREENLEMSGRIVHNIKGITGNYKIEAVHQTATELDLCFKKQRTANIVPLFHRMLSQIAVANTEIRQFFSEKGYDLPGKGERLY
jgi:HPt (histidine-containing phosphotransfer) domain-containing protein